MSQMETNKPRRKPPGSPRADRGFNRYNKLMRDKPGIAKHVANCKSCRFSDGEGNCNNNGVTEFDMVYEEHRTFCTFWKAPHFDNGRKDQAKDPWEEQF